MSTCKVVLKISLSVSFFFLFCFLSCPSYAIETDATLKRVFLLINNSLTTETPELWVHCQSSKGHDIGNRTIPVKDELSTIFLADPPGEPVYTCQFRWDPKKLDFNVYDKYIDTHCITAEGGVEEEKIPTISCYWHVVSDGFYMGTKDRIGEKFHDW
ncbi:hypothetical protein ACH5RR_025944 [Cinchona calisaya]|uniref:S-protein homolog n=1 Tax=Cinchona calisaya TaxID=153742 RepID=A0ABD2Z544_9GENT